MPKPKTKPKPKKRKPSKKLKMPRREFDVELTLLENRQLFLFEDINEKSARKIIKEIYALDTINHNSILMYINSPGGSCSDGLAIIDCMKTVQSPIITVITNEVCSMGGHISVAGDHRVCYLNSVWMSHDMTTYMEDYSLKIRDRANFIEKYYEILENNLIQHTKLNSEDLQKARTGELWLFAKEMKKKKIVDEILGF